MVETHLYFSSLLLLLVLLFCLLGPESLTERAYALTGTTYEQTALRATNECEGSLQPIDKTPTRSTRSYVDVLEVLRGEANVLNVERISAFM
jgi:hypothetical protein